MRTSLGRRCTYSNVNLLLSRHATGSLVSFLVVRILWTSDDRSWTLLLFTLPHAGQAHCDLDRQQCFDINNCLLHSVLWNQRIGSLWAAEQDRGPWLWLFPCVLVLLLFRGQSELVLRGMFLTPFCFPQVSSSDCPVLASCSFPLRNAILSFLLVSIHVEMNCR